jgi:hypothetical protein
MMAGDECEKYINFVIHHFHSDGWNQLGFYGLVDLVHLRDGALLDDKT